MVCLSSVKHANLPLHALSKRPPPMVAGHIDVGTLCVFHVPVVAPLILCVLAGCSLP